MNTEKLSYKELIDAIEYLIDDIELYLSWARQNGKTNSELSRIGKRSREILKKAKKGAE